MPSVDPPGPSRGENTLTAETLESVKARLLKALVDDYDSTITEYASEAELYSAAFAYQGFNVDTYRELMIKHALTMSRSGTLQRDIVTVIIFYLKGGTRFKKLTDDTANMHPKVTELRTAVANLRLVEKGKAPGLITVSRVANCWPEMTVRLAMKFIPELKHPMFNASYPPFMRVAAFAAMLKSSSTENLEMRVEKAFTLYSAKLSLVLAGKGSSYVTKEIIHHQLPFVKAAMNSVAVTQSVRDDFYKNFVLTLPQESKDELARLAEKYDTIMQ